MAGDDEGRRIQGGRRVPRSYRGVEGAGTIRRPREENSDPTLLCEHSTIKMWEQTAHRQRRR